MVNLLNTIAEHWYTWQIAMLWQTAVLIGIVWGIDLLIRKWAWPQVRYALWMLVLVKLLIPPTWTSPASITSHIPALGEKVIQIQIAPAPEENRAATAMKQPDTGPKGHHTIAGGATPGTDRFPQSSPNRATQNKAVNPTLSLSWKVYAMFGWLAGIIVLSTWLIIRLTGLRREHLTKGCHPGLRAGVQSVNDWMPDQVRHDTSGGLPERFYIQLVDVAQKLNLPKLPRVILTDRVSCPAVFGVLRPVLLMPAEKFRTMTARDTEHILLHELAHIKRGDLVVHAVYMMLQILYWFNPLLWMIRKTLQNLRELCCDATVAKLLKDNTVHYRQTLLETARQLLAEPVDPGLGLLGLFENSNWLVTRLRWLEKKTWKNRPLRIATVITLVAVMTACVLPMANRPEFAVTGTVTDAETGQPIAGAEIYDDGYNDNKIKTVTDEQGRFTLKTANEEHNISAKADGYQPQKKGLYTFPFANNKNFNFDLEQLSSSQSKDIKAWVEDFFKHNYRDITARKTLEWGEPITSDNGNISIRYKYEATIWGKDKIIENKVWTFDKQGKFIHVRKVGAEDIYSLAGVQALVEDFFANNYQDITQRKTIEWGLPVKHENGNVSIRYKYEATIWDADKVINNEIYTFDKNGKFISVKIVGLKDLNTYKNIDPEDLGIAVYKVNKLVSSFPESIDFSLPENTYVMAQRIIAEGNTSAWPEISASGLATRMQKTQKQSRAVDPDRAKKELNVKILEVHQKGDYAAVIARNPGLLPSYDTRSFKLENGKWLNTGNSGSQTLATARAIVDQGIDYRNLKQMESTQNSDLSRVEPRELKPAPSETEGTENFPFTATLDNGVTVELVGLCEHPSEGKQWWKPGGDLLDTSPYEKIETSHISPRHGRKALEAAVKIDGFEDGIGFRSGIVGTQSSGSCGTGDQKVYAVSFDQAKGSSQTDINIGIAAGQWQTVATQKPNFSGVYSSGSVIWHGPIEKDGGTVLHIGHSLLDNNIRVVAVGPDDKEHQGGSTSAQKEGLESVQINFDLPLSKIKEFRFQVRPYEWVTFKNVSLRPSEKMEVEVSIDKQSN